MTLDVAAGNHPVGTMHIGSPKGREHRALRAVFRAILSKTSKLKNSFKVKFGWCQSLISVIHTHPWARS